MLLLDEAGACLAHPAVEHGEGVAEQEVGIYLDEVGGKVELKRELEELQNGYYECGDAVDGQGEKFEATFLMHPIGIDDGVDSEDEDEEV